MKLLVPVQVRDLQEGDQLLTGPTILATIYGIDPDRGYGRHETAIWLDRFELDQYGLPDDVPTLVLDPQMMLVVLRDV